MCGGVSLASCEGTTAAVLGYVGLCLDTSQLNLGILLDVYFLLLEGVLLEDQLVVVGQRRRRRRGT